MSSTLPQDGRNQPKSPPKPQPKPSRGRSSSRGGGNRPAEEQRPGSSFLPYESAGAGPAEESQPPGSRAPFNLPRVGSATRSLLDEVSSEEETEETTESFVKLLEKDEKGRARMRAQKKELLQMEERMQGKKTVQRPEITEPPKEMGKKVGDMGPPPRPSGPRKPLTRHSFSVGTRVDSVAGTPPTFNFRHPLPPAGNQQLDTPSANSRISPNVQNIRAPRTKLPGLPELFGNRGGEYKSPYIFSPGSGPGSDATQQKNQANLEWSLDGSSREAGKPRSQSVGAAQRANWSRSRLSITSSSSTTSSLPPSGRTFRRREGEIIRDLLALSERFDVAKTNFFHASSSEAKRGKFPSHWVKFVDKAWDLLSFEMICGECKQVVECEAAEKIAVGLKGDLWKTRGEESVHVKAETLDGFQKRTVAVLNTVLDREGGVGRVEWD